MVRPLKLILTGIALTLSACAGEPRNPAPIEKLNQAVIPNLETARYWGDEPPENLDEIIAEIEAQRDASDLGGDITVLALSGGADDGAFGAGLLNAWTELGDRPEFTVVTGVSTGALSAPFAFLGPDYDDDLRLVYGGLPPEKIFKPQNWLNILPSASFEDSSQLAELIAGFADEEMLAAIAKEHQRGRRLFVQTSHLDAQRPVIWDLGAIASSSAPNAADVFRNALLASASVPVAFPPVMFEVEIDGELFDEMHADGGVISESTILSAWQPDLSERSYGPEGMTFSVYVVRNGRISPEPKQVKRSLTGIGGRAVSTLIKQQGVGDLLSAYVTADLRGADFYVTWIGDDFQHEYPGPFDPDYMQALFRHGYDLMMSGQTWSDKPPILMNAEERKAALRG